MKLFLHVFYTWLLTNLLHPFMFFLIPAFNSGEFKMDSFQIEVVTGITLFTLFASIPGFMLGWLILYKLAEWQERVLVKLFAWMLAVLVITIGNYIIFLYILGGPDIDMESLFFAIPVCIAGPVAIAIRYRMFYNLFSDNKKFTHEEVF
jgi:hypothetical protein